MVWWIFNVSWTVFSGLNLWFYLKSDEYIHPGEAVLFVIMGPFIWLLALIGLISSGVIVREYWPKFKFITEPIKKFKKWNYRRIKKKDFEVDMFNIRTGLYDEIDRRLREEPKQEILDRIIRELERT